jgi:glycosyltransferase involved in cell wall biosynthesis
VQRIGADPAKTVVIPNGVDLPGAAGLMDKRTARQALGLPVEGVLVGSVARLDPVKRLDVLLEALVRVEGARAFVVGYGSEEQRLTEMARELGLGDRIHFAGYQQDVWPWLAACDVFVLSSDWEGMPNAVLEAMGAGLPVAATAAGGTPDVVVDGVTGLLVSPGDAVALAAALDRLVQDGDLRRSMGAAGRQRVEEQFSAQRMVERTQALYTEMLDRD